MQQTISSEFVEATVERLPDCIVQFSVKVKPALIAFAEKEAAKTISKQTSIPGFRKGKAPFEMIKTKFSGALREEMQKVIADEAFRACQKEARIPILDRDSKISYNMENFTDNEAEMTFKFETEPAIPSFSIESLEFTPAPQEEVLDKDVDETVRRIQLFYASWEVIEDRGAEVGDFVIIDIEDLDTDPPTKPFQAQRFEVSLTTMAEWMRDLIIGLKGGESKEGKSHADSTDSDEVKQQYTEKKVRITVHKIEVPILPPIDDALAEKVGVATKEAMYERLRSNMTKQAATYVQNQNRERLAETLLRDVQFDIPASVLEKEMRYRINQRFQDPIFHKRWNNLSKEEQDKQQEALKMESTKAIRMYYICRKVVQENKISFSRKELYPEIETALDAMFADPATFNAHQQSKEQEALLLSRHMLSKAQDFMIEKILGK